VSSRKMAFQPPTYERSDRSMSSTVVREFQPPMDSMHLRRLRSQGGGQAPVTEMTYGSCFHCPFWMVRASAWANSSRWNA
jgi:hypothetical protein